MPHHAPEPAADEATVASSASAPAASAEPAWRTAALAYLDHRSEAWLDDPPQVRNHFECAMSCHTTLPYLALRPALGDAPIADRARARLIERVDQDGAWAEQTGFYGRPGNATWQRSLATEAVLNANALALYDHASGTALSAATLRALDRMWEAQRDDGGWSWLDFGYQPWEAGNDDWGVALASTAVGLAGPAYREAHARPVERLRGLVTTRLSDRDEPPTLHDQLGLLWAAHHWTELVPASDRDRITQAVVASQRDDGGWALIDLLAPRRTARRVRETDGYATGLATFVLCRDPQATEAAQQGLAWLREHQQADGSWPAWSLNRDRARSHLHMRDAAAAYATLALTTCSASPWTRASAKPQPS